MGGTSTVQVEAIARKLAIAEIGELPDDAYVGLIDPEAVEALIVRLRAEGLLTPIWVRNNGNAAKYRYSVIAGRHRLRAAIALGWTEIEAIAKGGSNSDVAELRRLQIVENLDRRDLRPIERSRFVMDRWREAAERIAPDAPTSQQRAAIRARWSVWAAIAHTPVGVRREVDLATAKECGRSNDRWVRTYRGIYEGIVVGLPQFAAVLNAHPLGASQSAMSKLAGLPDASRVNAAAMILSRDDWPNIQAVLVAAGIDTSTGSRTDPHQPDVNFLQALGKLKGPRRQSTLRAVASELTAQEVLDMIEVFKARRIIGDNHRIA